MFTTMARWVTRHPWWVVSFWVVVAVVTIALSPSLSKYTNANNSAFLPSSFQSVQAQNIINQKFPQNSGATGLIVINRRDGDALTSQDLTTVQSLATTLTNDKIPGVQSVTYSTSLESANKKVILVNIVFTQPAGVTVVNDAVPTIRNDTNHILQNTDLRGGLTGSAAIQVDTTNAYDTAETIITIATFALIIILLGIIFRSPLICIIPLFIILLVHQMVTGLVADLASAFGFQVSSILAPLLIVVLFGVGTDYIVFLLFRYRERLRAGEERHEALERGLVSTAEIVLSAALTVAAAFAALLLANLGTLKTLAPGLITAVLVMMLAANTLVPAILELLGKHLFWPWGVGENKVSKRAERSARGVGRHPGRYAAIFGLILVVLAIGIFAYKPTYNTLEELPKSTPSLQAYYTMASAFPPGALGPTQVVVNGSQQLTSSSLTNLDSILSKQSGVAEVLPATISTDKTAAYISVLLKDNPYDVNAMDYVEQTLRPAVQGSVPGDQVLVGGTTASLVDVRKSLNESMVLIFPVALAIILLILIFLLRAVPGSIYILVGVALAYVGTLGITSVVFISLGGLSGLDFSTPVVLYLFVLAIGTDYNIASSHRFREEMAAGHKASEAVRIALLHGAPMIDSAAVILAGTFASLMLTGLAALTELGFGVSIGILIAAFILSTRLVPAMSALRHWHFWWPNRFHQTTEVTRPTKEAAAPAARSG